MKGSILKTYSLFFFTLAMIGVVSAGLGDPITEIPLTTCQNLDQEGALYVLLNDIGPSDFTPRGCFNITAPSVTLDCQGYNITGTTQPASAIYSNQDQVTIDRCTIRMGGTPHSYGILLEGTKEAHLLRNTIHTTHYPLVLNSTHTTDVEKNTIIDSAHGITIQGGSENRIHNNEVQHSAYGLLLEGTENNMIETLYVNECKDPSGCLILNNAQNNRFVNIELKNASTQLITIKGEGSSHNRFYDGVLVKGVSYDVLVTGTNNRDNTFINMRYNMSKERVDASNELIRGWYFEADVKDNNDQPLDAALKATDSQSDRSFSLEAHHGVTPRAEALYYINNETQRIITYAIQIQKETFDTINEDRIIDTNTQAYYVLTTATAPVTDQPEEDKTGRCRSEWACSEWSACSNGVQTRSCTLRLTYCLPQNPVKPSESQTCTTAQELATPEDTESETQSTFARITGAVIGANSASHGMLALSGLLAAVLGGYLLVGLARKRKS